MGAFLARLRGLTSNRWAVAGLVGAAGLGGLVLLRGGGPGGADGPTQEAGEMAAASAGGQQSFPNTYATDLASAVGDLDSRYAEDLAVFAGTQTAAIAAAEALNKKQSADIASVVKKVNAIKVAPKKPAPKKPTQKRPARERITAKGFKTITVGRGDTLGGIARRYDTSVSALAKVNKIANPNRISAGAKLRVPVG